MQPCVCLQGENPSSSASLSATHSLQLWFLCAGKDNSSEESREIPAQLQAVLWLYRSEGLPRGCAWISSTPQRCVDLGRETASPALLQLSRWSLLVPAASTSSWMAGWRATGLLGGTCLTISPEWHICINAWVTAVNCCTQWTKSHRNPGAAEKNQNKTKHKSVLGQ